MPAMHSVRTAKRVGHASNYELIVLSKYDLVEICSSACAAARATRGERAKCTLR